MNLAPQSPLHEIIFWSLTVGPIAALTVLAYRMGLRWIWLLMPWVILLAFDLYWASGMLQQGSLQYFYYPLVAVLPQAAQFALGAGVIVLTLRGVDRAPTLRGAV